MAKCLITGVAGFIGSKPGSRRHPNHNQLALGLTSHSTITLMSAREAAGQEQQPDSRAFQRH